MNNQTQVYKEQLTGINITQNNSRATKPIFLFINQSKFSRSKWTFCLSLENNGGRISYTRYYLLPVEIRNYNAVIDGRNFCDQPVQKNWITYDNIRKTATGWGDNYATGCQLDYNYFNNYYKMIPLDLSKQQVLNADPRAIQ